LVAEAVASGVVRPDSPLATEGIDAATVFRAARDGDAQAIAIVDRLGDRLGRVCVLLASLLDIDRVVVAGAIAEPAAAVIERARALLDDGHFDRGVVARCGRRRDRGCRARRRRRPCRPAVVPAPRPQLSASSGSSASTWVAVHDRPHVSRLVTSGRRDAPIAVREY
ncbi:ROK family protein, partial [Bacillus sp. S34]|nr:ROK family protein [Bacillus sp. S34]